MDFFVGLKKANAASAKRRAPTICYWAWPAFGKFHLQFPPREEIKEEFSLIYFGISLGIFFLMLFCCLGASFFFEYSYIVCFLIFYFFHKNIL